MEIHTYAVPGCLVSQVTFKNDTYRPNLLRSHVAF